MKKGILLIAMLAISGMSIKAQWVQTNFYCVDPLECLAISGNNIFAGTWDGVCLSSNGGNSWTFVNNGLPGSTSNNFINSLAVSGNNIFAETEKGVYLSSDNGNNWTAVNNGLPFNFSYCFVNSLAISGNNIFAGVKGGGVFLSSNNGGIWTARNSGLPLNAKVRSLAISDSNIFVGIDSCGIFFSSNNGNSWVAVNNGLPPNLYTSAFTIVNNSIFAGSYIYTGGLFSTSNNGNIWVPDTAGLTNIGICSLTSNSNNIFAGGSGVFWSSNNGISWIPENAGLTELGIYALVLKEDTLYAGTSVGEGSHIWKLPVSALGIEVIKDDKIKISLYPNPATNTLTIETPQQSTIKISNTEGQLIKTLASTGTKTNVDHVGYSSYIVDVSEFPNGVYIVEVKTEKGIAVKKFVKE